MAQWIWQFGDYEIYHHLRMHNMRHHYGRIEPVTWKLYTPEPVVCFRKKFATTGGKLQITACGYFSVMIHDKDWKLTKYCGENEILFAPGEYTVDIRVSNLNEFPCIYVQGIVESDETWLADDLTINWKRVGTNPLFSKAENPPVVFPFQYETILYGEKEEAGEGVLFDFKKETYAKISLTGLRKEQVRVQFGESREEALDYENSVIHFESEPEDGKLAYRPFAFRYIYVSDSNANIEAQYEYLPLEYRGAFACDNDKLNDIWNTASYTFHLNCREFFLDGIKRDHWLWSADAYQCLFVNRYLFFDKDIEQRTIIALGGKLPFHRHLNEIMDYTFFWIISIYENYLTFGDLTFLRQIFPQMEAVMTYCLGRVDADGFVRKQEGDWIFIDWAPMDVVGALCGEQILFAKAMECYSFLCRQLGCDDRNCGMQARSLQDNIISCYFDKEKKVFIDSFESGKRNVSRQSNILAYLFLPCSKEQKESIYQRVINNPEIAAITTPYFKFYENQVRCEAGEIDLMQIELENYYGGMLDIGATTFFEEFDPTQSGAEHYAMYGAPYEKSLCHAWSASPVYLLGAYRMGVKNTGIAYDHYEVCPSLGNLTDFKGRVPVPGGVIEVEMNREEVCVHSDIGGGNLILGNHTYPIPVREKMRIRL